MFSMSRACSVRPPGSSHRVGDAGVRGAAVCRPMRRRARRRRTSGWNLVCARAGMLRCAPCASCTRCSARSRWPRSGLTRAHRRRSFGTVSSSCCSGVARSRPGGGRRSACCTTCACARGPGGRDMNPGGFSLACGTGRAGPGAHSCARPARHTVRPRGSVRPRGPRSAAARCRLAVRAPWACAGNRLARVAPPLLVRVCGGRYVGVEQAFRATLARLLAYWRWAAQPAEAWWGGGGDRAMGVVRAPRPLPRKAWTGDLPPLWAHLGWRRGAGAPPLRPRREVSRAGAVGIAGRALRRRDCGGTRLGARSDGAGSGCNLA